MLQIGIGHINERDFQMSNISPRIFEIERIQPRTFDIVHEDPRILAVTHLNERSFAVAHSNPRLFSAVEVWTPCLISVMGITFGAANYRPGSEMDFDISLLNSGGEGSSIISWQLLDGSDNIISSGTQNTGLIKWRQSAIINIAGIDAPSIYSALRLRAKGSGQASWIYSSVVYVLPCDLAVNSATANSPHYAPSGTAICNVSITNNGYSGSQLLAWELVNASDLTVISSGSKSSGTIGDFATTTINITGITVPALYGQYKIRVKAPGDEWTYSGQFSVLPVNLSVNAVIPGSDIFWPGTPVPCRVSVVNAGYSGSQTIEWEVIKTSDQSVLSSGSQSSGTIGNFAKAYVQISGIFSPSGGDILFNIRARIAGSATWFLCTWQLGNYMFIVIPPNPPTPRG